MFNKEIVEQSSFIGFEITLWAHFIANKTKINEKST